MTRVAKLLCPQTALAVGLPPDGPKGAENLSTREFLPSDTYRLPCESKANAVRRVETGAGNLSAGIGGVAEKILLTDYRIGGRLRLAVQHSPR